MLLLCCFVVLLNVGTNNGFIKVNYTTTESKIIGVLWGGYKNKSTEAQHLAGLTGVDRGKTLMICFC